MCYHIGMRNNDARRLTHTELTELRKRGVAAVQEGQPVELVAQVLGVDRSTLFGWLARYRRGGWDALDASRRGGRPPKVTAKMLSWVYGQVTTKDPRQLRFPFALWTSLLVAELIRLKFDIRLSKASVCRLLRQLGLSPQKPLWRAFQQDSDMVKKWLKEDTRRSAAWRVSSRRTSSLRMRPGYVRTFMPAGRGRSAVRRLLFVPPAPALAAT